MKKKTEKQRKQALKRREEKKRRMQNDATGDSTYAKKHRGEIGIVEPEDGPQQYKHRGQRFVTDRQGVWR